MIIENVIIVVIDSTDRKKGDFSFDFRRGGGGKNPPHLCSFWGGNLLRGRILPPSGTVKGGEFSPPGMISLPLEKLFLHALHMNLTITQQLFTDIFRV